MSRFRLPAPYSPLATVIFLASALTPCLAEHRAWQIESVESPRIFSWMTDRSLCLDTQGNPHLAFGQDHLYHGWHDGAQWVVEIVDLSPGVGKHASIASGADGSLYIAYFDELNENLKYASFDGTLWHIEVVGNGGKFTSVTLDSQGRPHITYEEEDLNYAWKDDDGWHIQVIDVPYAPGGFTSLALDSQGQPHIGHYEMVLDNLLYSFRDDAGWHTETVAEQGDVGMHCSIALDGSGRPHISYYDRWQSSIAYARKDPAGWYIEGLGRVGSWASLALDDDGTPHIGFCTTSGPVHAYHDGSAWVMETLSGMASYASLALDATGNVYLSHYVSDSFAGLRELRLAKKTQGFWETDTVSEGADVGMHTALAMDSNGHLHACYINWVGQGIRYATMAGNGWAVQQVGQSGTDLSLALDQQGHPHIGFYDDDADAICHAFMDGGGWHRETIQQNVWTDGGYTSIAVGTDGIVRMVYRVNRELIYAIKADSGWSVETVTPDQGFYTSLKLDASGNPHIAHHSWASRMCYTYRDGAGWHTEVVDDYGEGGQYCSLALDVAGFPRMTYYDNYPNDIRYAYRDAQGWHVETVDETNDVGKYTSLALDPQGRPCVSYLFGQAVDLRFAYREAGVWLVSTVSSQERVGAWSKLVVDAAGRPHVIYYNETLGDLMHAWADGIAGTWDTGLVGPGALTLLEVSPNPASTHVRVSLSIGSQPPGSTRPVSLRLFDLNGREVQSSFVPLSGDTHQVTVSLGSPGMRLPAGPYFLQVRADDPPANDGAPLIVMP